MFARMLAPFPRVRKIAVLRANNIGDFIFSLPALEALKSTYAGAELVLLGLGWHGGFLHSRPGPVDRVLALPRIRGVGASERDATDQAGLEHFVAAARAEAFDLAVQLHGGGRYSNPFILRLGARHTIGMRAPHAAALERWVPYVYFQYEVARLLEVVALAGAATCVFEPRLALTAQDRVDAAGAAPVASDIAVIHPGASDPRRRWPPERFARVADALAEAAPPWWSPAQSGKPRWPPR